MPRRQPTGRPRGRPLGTDKLGEHSRVTIRLPQAIYDRLAAYADGRTFAHGGASQFAACVREAIEQYLVCKERRQTGP